MTMPPFVDMTWSSIQLWFNGFFQVYSKFHIIVILSHCELYENII